MIYSGKRQFEKGLTWSDSCKFEKFIQKNKKNFHFAYYLLTPNPIKHEK